MVTAYQIWARERNLRCDLEKKFVEKERHPLKQECLDLAKEIRDWSDERRRGAPKSPGPGDRKGHQYYFMAVEPKYDQETARIFLCRFVPKVDSLATRLRKAGFNAENWSAPQVSFDTIEKTASDLWSLGADDSESVSRS